MKYVLVQCCPVPEQLAPVLERIASKTGARYQSIYRGVDARALLNKCGKHDQQWLWDHLGPGVANRPGHSTHELRNDGVAYRGPAGMPLAWWQCGIDIDDAHVRPFIQEAAKEGFTATITYPGSRVEYHHVNFRKAPIFSLPTLKFGSVGPRVVLNSRRLASIGYLDHGRLHFDKIMEDAVRAFQKHVGQKVDGTIGTQTERAILVTVRRHKKK